MLSAYVTQHLHALTSAPLIQTLSGLLIRSGAGPVAILRSISHDFDPDREDIDLLLTDAQRNALLQAALEEATAGRIHLTVRQKCSEKIQLTLFNSAVTRRLTVDLWSVFSQLPSHPRMMIPAEDLLPGPRQQPGPCTAEPGTIRLSADVDFCLLVLHLAVKAKPLNATSVRERLREAGDRLAASIPELVAAGRPMDELASLVEVSEQLRTVARNLPGRSVRIAEDYLLARLTCLRLLPRTNRSMITGLRSWLMKRAACAAVVGSDGSGKSSVCRLLTQRQGPGNQPIVAKKLYRRSWLYRIISSVTKNFAGTDRGRLDDRFPVLITLRAAVSLWWQFAVNCLTPRRHVSFRNLYPAMDGSLALPSVPACRPSGAPLLDRSLSSFLITNRKSDRPRLSRLAIWLEQILPPVTTVLLVVPFRTLVRRKAEFTSAAGHTRYQQLLFEQALRQRPCDLIVVANTGSELDASHAIDALRSCRQRRHRSEAQPPHALPDRSTPRPVREETAA